MAYRQWYNSSGYSDLGKAEEVFLGKDTSQFHEHACYGSLPLGKEYTVTRGILHKPGIPLEAIQVFVEELKYYFGHFANLRLDASGSKRHLYSMIDYAALRSIKTPKDQTRYIRLVYHTFLRTPQETPIVFSAAWNLMQEVRKKIPEDKNPLLYFIWVCYADNTLCDKYATKDVDFGGPNTYGQGIGHGWCSPYVKKIPASIESYLASVLYGPEARQITSTFASCSTVNTEETPHSKL